MSRKRVAWYEASINYYGEEIRSATFRTQTWFGYYQEQSYEQSYVDLLVSPFKLRDGLFQELLSTYQSSPYQKIIEQTTPHLFASYEDGYLESHLGNVYAALESLVGGLSDVNGLSFSLGSSRFKKLKKAVKKTITEYIEDKEVADSIVKKIPELRRKPFLDRLLILISQYNVDVSLLWPPDTDVDAQLQKILSRRNQLIHQGRMNNPSQYNYDFRRIQKLVELWLLKLLECPDDAINKYALWRDAPINKFL